MTQQTTHSLHRGFRNARILVNRPDIADRNQDARITAWQLLMIERGKRVDVDQLARMQRDAPAEPQRGQLFGEFHRIRAARQIDSAPQRGRLFGRIYRRRDALLDIAGAQS